MCVQHVLYGEKVMCEKTQRCKRCVFALEGPTACEGIKRAPRPSLMPTAGLRRVYDKNTLLTPNARVMLLPGEVLGESGFGIRTYCTVFAFYVLPCVAPKSWRKHSSGLSMEDKIFVSEATLAPRLVPKQKGTLSDPLKLK